jgi:L-ascorbate metabolism protein UlaG (beta-lactamase superfamily)
MKITKYPQSCILIEKNGHRLVIDPGSFVAEKYRAEDLLPVEAVLITHEHADHANPELIKRFLSAGAQIVANAGTYEVLGEALVSKVVEDGEAFDMAGFAVTARELPHVALIGGDTPPQNTGYVIDGSFFHAGDGVKLDGFTIDNAAIAMAGPDLSPKDAYDFAMSLNCKNVVPLHYNYFLADPQLFADIAERKGAPFRVHVLKDGESVEL